MSFTPTPGPQALGTQSRHPGQLWAIYSPRDVYETGGVIGAVCHGVAGLLNIELSNGRPLVDGKTLTSFTNEEEEAVNLTDVVPYLLETELIAKGAIHTKAPNFKAHVESSERVVTGQNPASAAGVAQGMVDAINA